MESNNETSKPVDQVFDGDLTERNAPVDFTGLVMYQYNRINQIGSKLSTDTANDYSNAVAELELLLSAYVDDKFEQYMADQAEEIRQINEGMKKPFNAYNERLRNWANLTVRLARIKVKGLVQLCARKNLFPAKRISLRA